MKGYYKISEARVMEGLLELWESNKYGDEAPAKVVTLNGKEIGETWESLMDFYTEDYNS